MLIVLPPSETKAVGGEGPSLCLEKLWLPELAEFRRVMLDSLIALSQDIEATALALKVSATRAKDIAAVNSVVVEASTCPAVERYTGVLYDALAVTTLSSIERARADQRLAHGSALFGVVRATDLIPHYRLSAGSKLPSQEQLALSTARQSTNNARSMTLASAWKPVLEPALAQRDHGLVIDLRSKEYQKLGVIPGAITVTVVSEHREGTREESPQRKVVSHFNKQHKGFLARVLATSRTEPNTLEELADSASKAGMRVELAHPSEMTIVV